MNHTPLHIEHEGGVVHCHDLGTIPAAHVLCNDFIVDPYFGSCHLIARESAEVVLTLWDCDGRGHVYHENTLVHVARPDVCRNRVWPEGGLDAVLNTDDDSDVEDDLDEDYA